MLWLLLLSLVFAPSGIGVDVTSEVNIYLEGGAIMLNFTSYANVPIYEVEPGVGVKDVKAYNVTFSQGAKIEVYEGNTKLCEAIANIPDSENPNIYWGSCVLPLTEGTHLLKYKITHPNYSSPILGHRRVIYKDGDTPLLSSSISPIGVDVGRLLVDYMNTLPKEVILWTILFIILIGSTLYYRGESLAIGIFDILFPRLPRPRADLGWAPGMTPGGPVIGAVKQMESLKELLKRPANSNFWRTLMEKVKSLDVAKAVLPRKAVPEAMVPLMLSVMEETAKNPKYFKKSIRYRTLLNKLADKLDGLANSSEPAPHVKEIDALLSTLSKELPSVQVKKDISRLKRIIYAYAGAVYYSKGYSGMLQKFFPGETFANYAKSYPEELIAQLKNRKFFETKLRELVSRYKKLEPIVAATGSVLDRATGLALASVGYMAKPPGMVLFWMGKTTRQVGVMLHQLALPLKVMNQPSMDPGEARLKAEQAFKARNEATNAAAIFGSGEKLLKISEKHFKSASKAFDQGNIVEGVRQATAGAISWLGAYFFPVRYALGFTVGTIYHSFRATWHDIRWWYYDVPFSKDLRPDSSQRIVNDSVDKVHKDAIRLAALDVLKSFQEKHHIRDLHNLIYNYMDSSAFGSNANLLKSEITRLFRLLTEEEKQKLNRLINIARIKDRLARQEELKAFLESIPQDSTYLKLAQLLVEELDSTLNQAISTKEGEKTISEVLSSAPEGNIEMFDAFLDLDRRIRERSRELGREWGLYEKDYQSPDSDDPLLTLTHNFQEDEMLWVSSINWATRLGDIEKGLGAAIALDIQSVQPITETWVTARMLGYEDPKQLFQDPDIDIEVKKEVLKELVRKKKDILEERLASQSGEEILKEIENVERLLEWIDDPRKKTRLESGGIADMVKDLLAAWMIGDESYVPEVWDEDIVNLWKSVPVDKNFKEMQHALYSHVKEGINEEEATKRALHDLTALKQAYQQSLEHLSPVFKEDVFKVARDLEEAILRDPSLDEVFNVHDDPVFEEGFASSKTHLHAVTHDEIIKAKSSVLDHVNKAEWFGKQLRGDDLTLNKADIPLLFMVGREGTSMHERTYLPQSYLQYKKGVHSQNMLVTLALLKKNALEVQGVVSSPITNYSDQIPNQIAHMVGSLMVTKRILESKGIDVLVEDISINDMKKILYGNERYKVEVKGGKLKVEEDEKGNLAGHGGALYNLPPYTNFMIVTRNDEAILKPLLYGEDGPRFVKEIKKISRRRFSALIDESYLASVTTERQSAADTVINVIMLRWDPDKQEYVWDQQKEVYLSKRTYLAILKDYKSIEKELSQYGSIDSAIDSFYVYGSPEVLRGLLENKLPDFDFLPKDVRGLAKELYSTQKYDQRFERLEQYLHMLKDKSLGAKLLLERLNWLKSGLPFERYFAEKKRNLLRIMEMKEELQRTRAAYALQKDASLYQKLRYLKSQLGHYADNEEVQRIKTGYYLGAMDSIKHNEWLGLVGATVRNVANKPSIMRYIKNSYIVDESSAAMKRAKRPPVKGAITRKVSAALKNRFYQDIYGLHSIVQHLFLPYAMKFEMADHGSSIAQLNYPAAQQYYDEYTTTLITLREEIESKGYLSKLRALDKQLHKKLSELKQEHKSVEREARSLFSRICKGCDVEQLAQEGNEQAKQYLELKKKAEELRKRVIWLKLVLGENVSEKELREISRNKDVSIERQLPAELLSKIPEIKEYLELRGYWELSNHLLSTIKKVYEVDKKATWGYVSSAWITTTRSPEKIFASIEGFGRGAQIAADFHAGSGLYYPSYIWWAHHAGNVFASVTSFGAKDAREFHLKGYTWTSLPIHQLSLVDYMSDDPRIKYRILVEETDISYRNSLRYPIHPKIYNRIGAVWRSLFQPLTVGYLAERAIMHHGMGGHGRLADSRQLYQAYVKSLYYTSALDVNYLATEEEIEALLSQLPPHMRDAARAQITYMITNKGYYSAKYSNIDYGSGFNLALTHLGAFSPFNPASLVANQSYLSFALQSVGMPFALPVGVLWDAVETSHRYFSLAYRHTIQGTQLLSNTDPKSSLLSKTFYTRQTDGMGVVDWEERIGYYLIPATKHTWYSPTIAKRSDLPGYGDVDINTGRVRVETWLPRMYLGREQSIYDTNRTYISWVARWRDYREVKEAYSPSYTWLPGLMNPVYALEYFRAAHARSELMPYRRTNPLAKIATAATLLAAPTVTVPLLIFKRMKDLSATANRTTPSNMDRCGVCGSPKRRGFRCPRCGAP